ncbi:MAG: hypothetical protein ACJASX_001299 [Limisphaerales bacterium]|jgi:hypothetical protein
MPENPISEETPKSESRHIVPLPSPSLLASRWDALVPYTKPVVSPVPRSTTGYSLVNLRFTMRKSFASLNAKTGATGRTTGPSYGLPIGRDTVLPLTAAMDGHITRLRDDEFPHSHFG